MPKEVKKVGRPKKVPRVEDSINETSVDKLEMDQKQNINENITIDNINKRWASAFNRLIQLDESSYKGTKKTLGVSQTLSKWNQLNPFLQNQRIKNLFTQPGTYSKSDLSNFLANPANNENQLRAAGWVNSSTQQIYYNILRRASDIPLYNYYIIPDLIEDYQKEDFKNENKLIDQWLELFNIPNSFKNIALQVKREGKQSYILRNKIDGEGKSREPIFAALEKMPSDWVKITGIGLLGYTISFNMMYFMNMANSPSFFGEFMVDAWNNMISEGIVILDDATKKPKEFNYDKAKNYKFKYKGEELDSSLESVLLKGQSNYMFWLKMPFDICYTFGSDNSHSWVAPDTMGLLMKLQELTDYSQLAGLIASTPLTAILTGEAEFVDNARANKNETKISPEVLQGLQDLFNATTSTNVEAMFFPLKNIKLQQLAADVNSSDIISNATENFVTIAGEGGLTITSDKPNVSQIKTVQLLAASQQKYVTLQFENVMNYIIKHKLGLKYDWKIKIWGDIFSLDNEKKFLKEIVANGNIALLPKLMSAESISMRDTKAIVEYIKSLDFYKEFQTYTMQKANEFGEKLNKETEKNKTGNVGRPSLDDSEVENDSTAKSRDDGTNTLDNRDTLSLHCPVCGGDLYEDQIVCEECAEKIIEEAENK